MNTKRWLYDPQTGDLAEKTMFNWWLPYALNAKDYYTVFADTEEEARRIVNARFEDKPREPTVYEIDLRTRVDESLDLIFKYAQVEGSHHKAWVIDQIVRTLTGQAYDKWIETYRDNTQDEWDEGIAP